MPSPQKVISHPCNHYLQSCDGSFIYSKPLKFGMGVFWVSAAFSFVKLHSNPDGL